MSTVNLLILVSVLYVAVLFAVAFWGERQVARGRGAWLNAPVFYTLSLSIYCTAWTFFGAVGYAARSGLEFLTIYLGPTLVMLGWWWLLRKLVRVGRAQGVTSVADLISSRYGKSTALAVLVTVMAVICVTPYIALQLASITQAALVFADTAATGDTSGASFWAAAGLAIFTVVFGTRRLNMNEQHVGIVLAIAIEAVVKLVALLAVGVFVVWGLADGPGDVLARIDASPRGEWQMDRSRWAALTFLSAVAFLCLPRMFQVMVVENRDERHLQVASWAFPAYLALVSLFVVPIAVVGLERLPQGANPDLFVLTLPLSAGWDTLAMLSFLGGFSSATSMVIVAALALATMVSNHIVMPIWLSRYGQGAQVSGDVRDAVILSRRVAIFAIIGLGYLYARLSPGGAGLAAIGLISFVGIAQFLPAMLGGLFWRGASGKGAVAGLMLGFSIWIYTSFLPSFGPEGVITPRLLAEGPWAIGWLRPTALFGIEGLDPTVHAVVWSLSLNAFAFVAVSLLSYPAPLERLQGAQFVNVLDQAVGAREWRASQITSEDLMIMTQRILGAQEASDIFRAAARAQGVHGGLPEPTAAFLQQLERKLSASVGAATAHAMVGQLVGGASISVEDLMAVADESAQMLIHSGQLEAKSAELARTAAQLRDANEKLTAVAAQKDAFLSQISHELRTPMTSIRAFAEILRDASDVPDAERARFAQIIHDDAVRLTRLLDDLLDLSVFESGEVSLHLEDGDLADVVSAAVQMAGAGAGGRLRVVQSVPAYALRTDLGRLQQVFINLISNAAKYCKAPEPELEIRFGTVDGRPTLSFQDNGVAIPRDQAARIFEKFHRVNPGDGAGAGLGLAICEEIMQRLGGRIELVPSPSGNRFVVCLPGAPNLAAAQ